MLTELVASNVPALFIKTQEVHRIDELLAEAIQESSRPRGMVIVYPHTAQIYRAESDTFTTIGGHKELREQLNIDRFYDALKKQDTYYSNNIIVLYGFKYYLTNTAAPQDIIFKMIDLVLKAKGGGDTIILVGDNMFLPSELINMFMIYEMPLPDTLEIEAVFKDAALEYVSNREDRTMLPSLVKKIPAAARIAQGLTLLEAENAFSSSLVMTGDIDYTRLMRHKASRVAQSDVLELLDVSTHTIDRVVGFSAYKKWLTSRKIYFDRKDSTLPTPKGCLLIGMSGVGKSMIAKATGNFLGLPTVRFDFSRVFRPLLGESEEVLEKALSLLEAIAPCSVFLDEINMSMGGADGSSVNDSGVMMKLMQMFLTWRQEKGKDVLITATGNSIETLPPMLYRAGRFDQIYFCDLPTTDNRIALLRQYFSDYGVDIQSLKSLNKLSALTEHFSGSEVEQAVVNALYMAAHEGENPQVSHMIDAIASIRPISKYHNQTMERMLHTMAAVGVLDVETGLPVE